MLKKILDNKTCAECKVCCAFDRYDVWETPILTRTNVEHMFTINPDIKIIKKDNSYSFKIKELNKNELFYCPVLDHDKGCMLGDEKPFDCKIWPFRIMNLCGKRVITISPICKEMFNQPLSNLVAFLKNELLDEIITYANAFPEAVKPYDSLYPILYVEN
jgi:Fe-S-cluster containining protein